MLLCDDYIKLIYLFSYLKYYSKYSFPLEIQIWKTQYMKVKQQPRENLEHSFIPV